VKPLDLSFVRAIYVTSGLTSFFTAAAIWLYWGQAAALGIVLGSALFLACLYVIERGVRRCIRPGVRDSRPLLLYTLGTYPALALILWAVARARFISLPAFAAGVALPILVIVLKAIGHAVIGSAARVGAPARTTLVKKPPDESPPVNNPTVNNPPVERPDPEGTP
jgi:small-conductance mechanosensitive channel